MRIFDDAEHWEIEIQTLTSFRPTSYTYICSTGIVPTRADIDTFNKATHKISKKATKMQHSLYVRKLLKYREVVYGHTVSSYFNESFTFYIYFNSILVEHKWRKSSFLSQKSVYLVMNFDDQKFQSLCISSGQ